MREITIDRIITGKKFGTISLVYLDGVFIGVALECYHNNGGNKPFVDCIPQGYYRAKWTYSPRFKRHLFQLQAVPNRTHILIHPANFAPYEPEYGGIHKSDLQGCIALGYKQDYNPNRIPTRWITESAKAVEDFHMKVGTEDIMVVISETSLEEE